MKWAVILAGAVGATALLHAPVQAGIISSGDLVVLQTTGTTSNTSANIVEVAPAAAGQTPTNIIAVPTGTSGLRFSGSGSSTGYLSHTGDGSLTTFSGVVTTDTASNANTITSRGVGSIDAAGNFLLNATYTGGSGNQARSASSLDNSTFTIGDQGGVYTNNATSASPSGNFRGVKPFGSITYLGTTTTTVSPVGTLVGGVYTSLPGLRNSATSDQDFYFVRSGSNGSTYDVLYLMSATSATAGTIEKWSLSGGSWVANGSYATTFGGFGMAASDLDATDATPGAALFVTTGTGATSANSLLRLTDTAGYNATISITTASNVTLFTTGTGTILKGVDLAPVPEPSCLIAMPLAGLLLARRRKMKA